MNKARSEALQNLMRIGAQMSHLCFNLSQRTDGVLRREDCETMKTLQTAWDFARVKFYATVDHRDRLKVSR